VGLRKCGDCLVEVLWFAVGCFVIMLVLCIACFVCWIAGVLSYMLVCYVGVLWRYVFVRGICCWVLLLVDGFSSPGCCSCFVFWFDIELGVAAWRLLYWSLQYGDFCVGVLCRNVVVLCSMEIIVMCYASRSCSCAMRS